MHFQLVRVQHDQGLALIYGAVLGGWVYLIVSGLFGLLITEGPLKFPRAEWLRLVAPLAGLVAFVVARKSFLFHDKNRYRPKPPGWQPGCTTLLAFLVAINFLSRLVSGS